MAQCRLTLITLILSVLNYIVFSSNSKQWDCTWSYENANFSLCRWQQTSDSQSKGYWEVYDERRYDPQNNFTYQFNICGDVVNKNNLNEMCTNNTLRQSDNHPIGYCNDIVNGTCVAKSISAITSNVAVYQMPRNKSNIDCYRLHDGISQPTFSLIDDEDPSIGVSIKYSGGDWCKAYGKNREFVINFYCADNYENEPDIEEKISEPSGDECTYILEIDSSIGCPLQCKVINDKVCDGNGICQYDETNRRPKCFCYQGWYGEDCSATFEEPTHIEIQHDDAGDITLLISSVVVLTIIMLVVIYLLIRVYKAKMGTQIGISDEEMAIDIQQHNKSEKKKVSNKIKSTQSNQQGLLNDDNDHPIVV